MTWWTQLYCFSIWKWKPQGILQKEQEFSLGPHPMFQESFPRQCVWRCSVHDNHASAWRVFAASLSTLFSSEHCICCAICKTLRFQLVEQKFFFCANDSSCNTSALLPPPLPTSGEAYSSCCCSCRVKGSCKKSVCGTTGAFKCICQGKRCSWLHIFQWYWDRNSLIIVHSGGGPKRPILTVYKCL